MCPECGVMVVITPDGTICCPKCGSVIEVKSILFKQNPGSTEKDEPTEENQTWRDIGLPSVTEDDMPNGYGDITHPEEDDDYGTEQSSSGDVFADSFSVDQAFPGMCSVV